MKYQLDKNYGRTCGWLFQRIIETMPGYWEMLGKAVWFPDGWTRV